MSLAKDAGLAPKGSYTKPLSGSSNQVRNNIDEHYSNLDTSYTPVGSRTFNQSAGVSYNPQTVQKPNDPVLNRATLGGLEVGDKYGLTYDYNKIAELFSNTVSEQYKAQELAQQASENKYYQNMAAAQGQTIDTLRRANASAISTGASKGVAAAQQVATILGLQQETAKGATDLATQRATLAAEREAAIAQAKQQAFTTSETQKQNIAKLAQSIWSAENQMNLGEYQTKSEYLANLYNADVQNNVGLMDYYATLDQSAKNLAGMNAQANANYAAAQAQANASMSAAQMQANANKYTADKNYANSQADRNAANNLVNSNPYLAYAQAGYSYDDIVKILNGQNATSNTGTASSTQTNSGSKSSWNKTSKSDAELAELEARWRRGM